MSRFEPFPGVRYDPAAVRLADVLAPPYDVVDKALRAELAARSDRNAVCVDLPVEAPGCDRYEVARRLLAEWLADGTLRVDDRPTFTVYRMSYRDEAGRDRRTTGVIGALELEPPGERILPHEDTTPKALSDRLAMLRACRANLSPIWGLSLADGLTGLLAADGAPLAEVTDDEGVRHEVWLVEDPASCAAIAARVSKAPVVIADGHHRYETALAYMAEREAAEGAAGRAAATMAYIVELAEDQLSVQAIHRLLCGLPTGFDLLEALSRSFEPRGSPPPGHPISRALERQGALCLVLGEREVLMAPRPEALPGARDIDSSRVEVALAALPEHQLRFQHGVELVREAVRSGEAQAGLLLRPPTIAQIEATARRGERMPAKTTFFHPKPRTGLVFRQLD